MTWGTGAGVSSKPERGSLSLAVAVAKMPSLFSVLSTPRSHTLTWGLGAESRQLPRTRDLRVLPCAGWKPSSGSCQDTKLVQRPFSATGPSLDLGTGAGESLTPRGVKHTPLLAGAVAQRGCIIPNPGDWGRGVVTT